MYKKIKNKKFHINNQLGSTLLNLVLAMAIFGIISAISAPTLKQYQPNLRLKGESKKL